MHRSSFAVLAFVAGCWPGATRTTGIEPTFRLGLHGPGHTNIAEVELVEVGHTLHVSGDVSATCTRDTTKWGDKNESTEYSSCDEQAVDLAVTCAGPCTVQGTEITPTEPGWIDVQIEMVTRATKRRYTSARRLQVVPEGGFTVRDNQRYSQGCAWLRDDGETISCAVGNQYDVSLQIVEPFGSVQRHELTINGQPWKGSEFNLRPYLLERSKTDPRVERPQGTIQIELVRNGFRRVVIFELPPLSGTAPGAAGGPS